MSFEYNKDRIYGYREIEDIVEKHGFYKGSEIHIDFHQDTNANTRVTRYKATFEGEDFCGEPLYLELDVFSTDWNTGKDKPLVDNLSEEFKELITGYFQDQHCAG